MLLINVYMTKKCGLEVYVVTINGVETASYMSREFAMAHFMRLKHKYSNVK